MKKTLILTGMLGLFGNYSYAIPPSFTQYDHNRTHCGTVNSPYGVQEQVCLTSDFLGKAARVNRHSSFWSFLSAEGRSGYNGYKDLQGGWLDLYNQTQDMQGHVMDFNPQGYPPFALQGYNSTLKNGTILGAKFLMTGQQSYFAPNFKENKQYNNISVEKYGFLYANNNLVCDGKVCTNPRVFMENQNLKHINLYANWASLESWGGSVQQSQIVINTVVEILGSKFTFNNNTVWSKAEPLYNKVATPSIKTHTALIDTAQGFLPDLRDRTNGIVQSTLYVKYSPDTVIDGNTFHLTHPQAGTYAIVLDHSPRVKITNNTFNGYQVPILMDEFSSIVDDRGNVIHPNQYTGPVVMQRNGQVVAQSSKSTKKTWFQF
ncbi:hypothetical protein [Acinetobacter boissieri]|uniref:Uncharacterized protein n=1 Tax=Acinetobacter boissieri TaxID=1219383 RepID=A0A1G6JTF3_9GAMM|nr:hypothetical protein [Acinetobacter boissieri]SDC21967.1 hypothetical protein SAMN05421733_11261 [Acinetobacter boissieri]